MSTEKEKRINTLKEDLMTMEKERKSIESKLKEHRAVLEANNIGMRESLTDEKDYPRNDIDIYAVRTARHGIITLENDAKSLFNKIQSKLEELHTLSRSDAD